MIKLENVYYTVKKNSLLSFKDPSTILRDINLEINKGEIVGIVGESGAGKTTLAKILSGIIQPSSGNIYYKQRSNLNLFNEISIQILFQNSEELINPLRSINEILTDVTDNDSKKVDELLNLVDLNSTILSKLGKNLSGGERQRVGLIRVLAVNPEILIVDEPFSAQDIESQINLMKLLRKINDSSNLTIVSVSHDLKIISKMTDKLIVMKNGEIIEQGLTSTLLNSPKHSYTQLLIRSMNYDISSSDSINSNF